MGGKLTEDQLKTVCEALRDELTEPGKGQLIYPMALDVIATTPALCRLLAARIRRAALEDDANG